MKERETERDTVRPGISWPSVDDKPVINIHSTVKMLETQQDHHGSNYLNTPSILHQQTSTRTHTHKYKSKRAHVRCWGTRWRWYSLVPSSETIPRPSALFCLSNAFRSRTLPHKESQSDAHTQGNTHWVRHTGGNTHWDTHLHVCIRAWTLRKNPTSFLSFR